MESSILITEIKFFNILQKGSNSCIFAAQKRFSESHHSLTFTKTSKLTINMTGRKIHLISGLILSIYIGLHLFNHVCSVYSIDKHIEIMNELRHIYRNVFIETILIITVYIQIISGVGLFIVHRKTAFTSFEKLHIWTGLYLAIFFVIHLSAVLAGRYILHLDTNFYFGAAGINYFPFNLFFIPYYALAIISFFGHIASIYAKKIKLNILNLTPKFQTKIILVFGLIFTLIVFYGLTNHFQGVQIPKEYNILIGE